MKDKMSKTNTSKGRKDKTIRKDEFANLLCDHKGCGHSKELHAENGCESIFFTANGDYWCNCKKFKNSLMKYL